MTQSFASSETEHLFATGKSRRLPQDILKHTAKGDTNMVKNRLSAIHPGVFLAEILGEMDISHQAEFARTVGVSAMRISHVIKDIVQ